MEQGSGLILEQKPLRILTLLYLGGKEGESVFQIDIGLCLESEYERQIWGVTS